MIEQRTVLARGHLPRVVALLAAALLLTACSQADTPSPAPTPSTTTAGSTTPSSTTPSLSTPSAPTTADQSTPPAEAPATAPAGNGCPANDATIPTGAGTATTGDVDLDGQPDTIWLTSTPARTLGITTATGATFSTTFTNAAPEAASALGQKLQPAGPAIVLLNTGRSVELYTVLDCQLVPTRNQQGQQYTFDLGFTGYGTGVGCIAGGDEEDLSLVGLNAVDIGGDRFRITQTSVQLTDFGRRARNGETTVLAEDVGVDDPMAVRARTVGCGNAQSAAEPQ